MPNIRLTQRLIDALKPRKKTFKERRPKLSTGESIHSNKRRIRKMSYEDQIFKIPRQSNDYPECSKATICAVARVRNTPVERFTNTVIANLRTLLSFDGGSGIQ